MKSTTDREFWPLYHSLPGPIRQGARRAYRKFADDPDHPSLRFKKLAGYEDLWSARINDNYRCVGVRTSDTINWFWIGTHADFDRHFG